MHDIENYMLEEHWELRQAATELMCNMSVYSETIKWFEDEKYDRLKVIKNHNFSANCFVDMFWPKNLSVLKSIIYSL